MINPGEMEKKRKWMVGKMGNVPYSLKWDPALSKCNTKIPFGFSVRSKSLTARDQK